MSQYHPLPEHCADTVPIKVNRVFDSCSDRDCFSNIQILMDGGRTAGKCHYGEKPLCPCFRHLHEHRTSSV